jgi:hypothetical protein
MYNLFWIFGSVKFNFLRRGSYQLQASEYWQSLLFIYFSVARITLLYIISEAVIPAPISIGINSSGNSVQKHSCLPVGWGFPRIE